MLHTDLTLSSKYINNKYMNALITFAIIIIFLYILIIIVLSLSITAGREWNY